MPEVARGKARKPRSELFSNGAIKPELAPNLGDHRRVAASLLASLDSDGTDDDAEIDRLWSIETDRRAAMLESGEGRTFTRDEVLEGLSELRANRNA